MNQPVKPGASGTGTSAEHALRIAARDYYTDLSLANNMDAQVKQEYLRQEQTWGNDNSSTADDVLARRAADLVVGSARTAGHLAALADNSIAENIAAQVGGDVIAAYVAAAQGQATDEQMALLDKPTKVVSQAGSDHTLGMRSNTGETNFQVVQKMLGHMEEGRRVADYWSSKVDGIQDQRGKQALDKDLHTAWEKGDGALSTFVRGLDALAGNPSGVAAYVTENLPQLGLGAINPALMALANAGYASDVFNKGVMEYRKANDGKLPDAETLQGMLMWSQAAGMAEQVGEALQLGTILKAGRAMGMTAEMAEKVAETAGKLGGKAGQVAKDGVANFATEAVTEGFQTTVENTLSQGKEAKYGAEEFAATMIGGASGGAIATTASAAAQAAQGVAEGIEQNAVDAAARQLRDQAITEIVESGDLTPMLDRSSEDYVAEDTAAALQQAYQKADSAETKQQHKDSLLKLYGESRDAFVQAAEAAEANPKDKAAQAALEKAAEEYEVLADALDHLNTQEAPSVQQSVETALTAEEPAEVDAAIERTFHSMRQNRGAVSVEQAEALIQSGRLAQPQVQELQHHIEVSKTMEQVGGDVYFGGKGKKGNHMRGLSEYRTLVADAIQNGDKATANRLLGQLRGFAKSHNQKSKAADMVLAALESGESTAQSKAAEQFLMEQHAFKVMTRGKGRELVDNVRSEAAAIRAVGQELSFLYRQEFGATTAAPQPEVAEAPQTEPDPVQAPAPETEQSTVREAEPAPGYSEEPVSRRLGNTKRRTHTISTRNGNQEVTVAGELEMFGARFIGHRSINAGDPWTVSDERTGGRVATGATLKEALANAQTRLAQVGKDRYTKAVSKETPEAQPAAEVSNAPLETSTPVAEATPEVDPLKNPLNDRVHEVIMAAEQKGESAQLSEILAALIAHPEATAAEVALAKRIAWWSSKMHFSVTVRINPDMDPDIGGRARALNGMKGESGEIEFSPQWQITPEIILHEALHTLTSLAVYNIKKLTPKQQAVIRRLEQQFALFKEKTADSESSSVHNAKENLGEYISYGMTNREMQEALHQIKVGDESLLTQFVNTLMDLLGLKNSERTLFVELVLQTEALMDALLEPESAPEVEQVPLDAYAEQLTEIAPEENTPVAEPQVPEEATATDGEPEAEAEHAPDATPVAPETSEKTSEPTATKTWSQTLRERLVGPDVKGKTGNRIVDYFRGNPKRNTPIEQVPDFFRALLQKQVDLSQFVREDTFSEEQQYLIDSMRYYGGQLGKMFAQVWKDRSRNKDGKLNPIALDRDMVQNFVDANGKLDENVVGAMVVAAYQFIAFEAPSLNFNDRDAINKILGRDGKHPVSKKEWELLGQAGLPNRVLIESLGRVAYQALGLKPTPQAPLNYEQNLINSLGSWTFATLVKSGVLHRDKVALSSLSSEFSDGVFVTVAGRYTEEGRFVLPEDLQIIVDSNIGTASMFSRLFGVEQRKTGPSRVASDEVQAVRQNTPSELTETEKRAIEANQKQPWKVNTTLTKVYQALPRKMLEQIAGVVHQVEGKIHSERQASVEGANQALLRELNHFEDMLALLEKDGATEEELFFLRNIWVNGRIGVQSNTVNPQTSKIHRWLLKPAGLRTTIDKTNREQMAQFLLMVAQGLGVDVDKQSDATTLAQVQAKLTDPAIMAAVEALKAAQAGETLSQEQQQAILEGVQAGGEKFHSLDVLHELAKWDAAEGEFETSITMEVDGITNGPIIGTLQFYGADNLADMHEKLKRGGVFFNMPEVAGAPDFFEQQTNFVDSYLAIAKEWGKELNKKLTREIQAVGYVWDVLDDQHRVMMVSKPGRNLAKNPLMTMIYGAGIESIITKMKATFVQDLYKRLEKLAALEDGADKARKVSQMNAALAILNDGKNPGLNPDNLLDWVMPEALFKNAMTTIDKQYGAALNRSIDTNHGTLIEHRKTTNAAMQVVAEAFSRMHTKLLNAARKEGVLKGTISTYVKKDGTRVAENDITVAQHKKILEQLKVMMPLMRTPLSETQEQGLFVGKWTKQEDPAFFYGTEVQTNGELGDGMPYTKLDMQGKRRVMAEPGVSPVVLAIQNLDASNMILNMLEGIPFQDVHDAVIVGFDGLYPMAEATNSNFAEVVMGDHTIIESAKDTLISVMKAFHALDPQGYREFVKHYEIKLSKDEVFDVQGLLKRMKYESKMITKYRGDLLNAGPVAVNQFGFNGGVHHFDIDFTAEGAMKALGKAEARTAIAASGPNVTTKAGFEAAMVLGSQEGDFDFDAFHHNEEITEADLLSLFDRLGVHSHKQESPRHAAYLRELLDTKIKPVMDAFTVHIETATNKVSQGAVRGMDLYLLRQQHGIRQPRSSYLGHDLRMSDQEVLGHELVHLVSRAALNNSNTPAYRQLKAVWKKASETITPEMLMVNQDLTPGSPEYDAEYQAAEDRWNYMFTPQSDAMTRRFDPITGVRYTEVRSNYLHEFLAFAVTNERLRGELAKIPAADVKVKLADFKEMKLLDQLIAVVTWAIDALIGRIQMRYMDKNAGTDVLVDHLFVELIAVREGRRAKLWEMADAGWNWTTGTMNKVTFAAKEGVRSAAGSRAARSAGRGVAGAVRALTGRNVVQVADMALGIAEDVVDGRQGFFGELATELRGVHAGNARAHELLRASRKMIDQDRKHLKTDLKADLLSRFGRELAKEEKESLTRVMLRTDLSALLDRFSLAQIEDMVRDPQVLLTEINNLEAAIDQQFPAHREFFKRHAINTAHYMVTETSIDVATLFNAHSIATLTGTSHRRLSEARTAQAEALLEELITLRALQRTDQSHRNAVAQVMREEANRTVAGNNQPGTNGIEDVLKLHKLWKQRSLDANFQGQKHLLMKGFIKDVTNPQVEMVMAPADQREEMEARGYQVLGRPLSRDPADRVRRDMLLFKHPNGALENYNAGIMSLMNHKAKGQNLVANRYLSEHSVTGAVINGDLQAMKQAYQHRSDSMFQPAGNRSRRNENLMLPILDGTGKVQGFRYTMASQTKDVHLERRMDLFEVFPDMMADVSIKQASAKVNTMTIRHLKASYDNRPAGDRTKYLAIGPRSTDPEIVEKWQMLPDEAKEEIRQVWGSDTMMVPRAQYHLLFGHRNLSVNALWRKERHELAFYQRILRSAFEFLFGRRAAQMAKSSENVLRDLARMGKDAIVVKSGFVLLGNMLSNIFVMKVAGVAIKDIWRAHADAFTGVREYHKSQRELTSLKADLAIKTLTPAQRRKLEARKAQVQETMAANPVHDLVEQGLLPTIVDDVTMEDDGFGFKSAFDEKFDEWTGKLPPVLNSLVRVMSVSHDTQLYQSLSYMTQISDFIGRYAMYHHLTKNEGWEKGAAINESVETFVNYELPTNPMLQYANDLGFLWFTKYVLRVQKVIMKQVRDNPGGVLLLSLLGSLVGGISYIGNSFFLFGGANHVFHDPLDAIQAMGEVAPVKLAEATVF